jgi:hypothetical protein
MRKRPATRLVKNTSRCRNSDILTPRPKRGPWRWTKQYWRAGDQVHVPHPFQGEPRDITIERVTRNRYGRVSYHAGKEQYLLEELIPAKHRIGP